ncbi:MAG: hypothetical protein HRF45_00340 [Fimbriimonadia bacterium]|jgi:hypothetical protein
MRALLSAKLAAVFLLLGIAIASTTGRAEAQPIQFTVPLDSCLAAPGTLMPGTLEIYTLTCERVDGGDGLLAFGQENLFVAGVGPGTYHIRVKVANWLTVWVRNVTMGWSGATLTFPTAVNGDVNGNDVVELADVSSILVNFGNTGAPGIVGDLNWDGTVTLQDVTISLLNFGKAGEGC